MNIPWFAQCDECGSAHKAQDTLYFCLEFRDS